MKKKLWALICVVLLSSHFPAFSSADTTCVILYSKNADVSASGSNMAEAFKNYSELAEISTVSTIKILKDCTISFPNSHYITTCEIYSENNSTISFDPSSKFPASIKLKNLNVDGLISYVKYSVTNCNIYNIHSPVDSLFLYGTNTISICDNIYAKQFILYNKATTELIIPESVSISLYKYLFAKNTELRISGGCIKEGATPFKFNCNPDNLFTDNIYNYTIDEKHRLLISEVLISTTTQTETQETSAKTETTADTSESQNEPSEVTTVSEKTSAETETSADTSESQNKPSEVTTYSEEISPETETTFITSRTENEQSEVTETCGLTSENTEPDINNLSPEEKEAQRINETRDIIVSIIRQMNNTDKNQTILTSDNKINKTAFKDSILRGMFTAYGII